MMRNPLFLIGNPRSGTTLLRLMLTCHPRIVIPPECGFLIWWCEKYISWSGYSDAFTKRYDEFLSDLFSSKKFETWHLEWNTVQRFLQSRQPKSYPELVTCVYECYSASCGKPSARWGDKNNFHVRHLLTLRSLFPACFFVHIVRDGRDVACSYRELHRVQLQSQYAPRLPSEVSAIAKEWVENVQQVRNAFDSLHWNSVHEVRFEDLVQNPREALTQLCTAIDEEYDDNMLEYAVWNRKNQLEPQEFLLWKEKTLLPPTTEVVGRFRRELEPAERKEFEHQARAVLHAYSYF